MGILNTILNTASAVASQTKEDAAKLRDRSESRKNRIYGRGTKCFFCRRQFGPHDVSKSVVTHRGGVREACRGCASAMGVKAAVNIIAHPPKAPKAKPKAPKAKPTPKNKPKPKDSKANKKRGNT